MRKLLVIIAMLLVLLTGCNRNSTELNSRSESTAASTVYETIEESHDTAPTDTKSAEDADETLPSFSAGNETTEETEPTVESTEESTAATQPQKTPVQETTQTTEPVQTDPPETTAPIATEPPQTETTEPVTATEPEGTQAVESTDSPRLAQADSYEVAALVAQYVNQYRSTPATILPGLGEVATYRANQLISNFSHADSATVCTALQYGEFVDMTLYGCPESSNYYQGYNREAIAKGNWTGTADEIAQRIATGFKNSAKHWAYIGSDEYGYMAVGVAYDPSNSTWYCCICMSSKNYGG